MSETRNNGLLFSLRPETKQKLETERKRIWRPVLTGGAPLMACKPKHEGSEIRQDWLGHSKETAKE